MDLCDPVALLQGTFPGAERALAAEPRCWTLRASAHLLEKTFPTPASLSACRPLSKSRGADHWPVGPVSAHRRAGGWENCCPSQLVRPHFTQFMNPLASSFPTSTLSLIGLLEEGSQRAVPGQPQTQGSSLGVGPEYLPLQPAACR